MEFLADYGMFLLKSLTWVVAILITVGGIVSLAAKGGNKGGEDEQLTILNLNEKYADTLGKMQREVLGEEAFKALKKQQQKDEKAKAKADKKAAKKSDQKEQEVDVRPRAFVLEFDGDVKASAVEQLRKEITAVLTIAKPKDEVVINLESPGGMVHCYGLAASQLSRIKDSGIQLSICVDKVAASGGYLMACIANKIVAAPFAIVGSIGVIAQLPNFNKVLKKNDIEIEMHTAGEYKRTLTMFGENTDEGRSKFKQDIAETHDLFKGFVSQHRPNVDIEAVATGDIWYGSEAVENNMVDAVMTSDQYITSLFDSKDVFEVSLEKKKTLGQRLGLAAQGTIESVVTRIWGLAQANQVQSGK